MLSLLFNTLLTQVRNHRQAFVMMTIFLWLLVVFSHVIGGESQMPPVVLGHRGAAGVYPEHTSLAYEKGADLGADYIECDVQVTEVSF